MDKYRVKPDQKVNLAEWDPNETSQFDGPKEKAEPKFEKLAKELGELQEVMFAQGKQKVLIVFQAMDTGGKDGVVRAVFSQVNPQGMRVASFKAPTAPELAHDYLWRIHQQVPGKGELVIFNRSQYEDVLVVRVHNLVPEDVWKKRYEHINAFEKMWADEGTTILKFYLHIDKDEQRERLLERIDTPEKRWKFNPGDLEERKLWDQYMQAFETVLEKTSTPWAPWYIVPANRNWYRNLVVADTIVDTLRGLKMTYPTPKEDITQYRSQL